MEPLARLFGLLRASPLGAALVEILLVAPAVAILAAGAILWGQYFWLSHQVQRAANRAVAAARAEPGEGARLLAQLAAASELDRAGLSLARAQLDLERDGQVWSAQLIYDASATPIFALSRLLPGPSATIVRLAAGPAS